MHARPQYRMVLTLLAPAAAMIIWIIDTTQPMIAKTMNVMIYNTVYSSVISVMGLSFSFSYSCEFSVTATVIVFQFVFLFQLVILHNLQQPLAY